MRMKIKETDIACSSDDATRSIEESGRGGGVINRTNNEGRLIRDYNRNLNNPKFIVITILRLDKLLKSRLAPFVPFD